MSELCKLKNKIKSLVKDPNNYILLELSLFSFNDIKNKIKKQNNIFCDKSVIMESDVNTIYIYR